MKKILLFLVLTACTNDLVYSTLGLDVKAPDEFLVNVNPPLVIPENFNLPEPKNEIPPQPAPASLSDAEASLLRQT
jgi:hypothetical protein